VTNFWREEEARWTAERRIFYQIDQGREYQGRKLEKRRVVGLNVLNLPLRLIVSQTIAEELEREREGLEITRNLELW
jgi:hypothetical protein